MSKAVVAVVGRPNVGKSTLFNRVVGRREAVVENIPGVTRDRLYGIAEWNGREFTIVDTGGLVLDESDPMAARIRAQAELAIEEADVIVMVVDGTDGLTPLDEDVAKSLRPANKPVLVAVNKTEGKKGKAGVPDFYALGIGELFPISATQGDGVADLLDEVVARLPPPEQAEEFPEDVLRVALIGRPNVGKSSMLNAILGEERVIVSNVPGTTRDAVDTYFERGGQKYVLVDTAGIRRPGKVQGSIEYYCVLRASRAIESCDVAIVVINGEEGLVDGDKRVAGMAHEEGRACVIAVNKWDLMRKGHAKWTEQLGRRIRREFTEHVRAEMPFLDYAPIVFVSALMGENIDDLLDTVNDVAESHARRVPTGELNRVIQDAVDANPRTEKGRTLRIYYATMSEVSPPTIILFVNDPELMHFSYERYLINRLRQVFGYEGTPIRLITRRRTKEMARQTG
ncbi:MAG: ribosome biogenesis GTPase Der [Armatimonadetes bacterium]|jgi:GTP-binding protein|nr:ribosome biogenesis GTPase Der [Armatimonadota bacterium]HOM81006.1 ribosome biogenesis GTPase Der [Armatimonadota bacterium]HOQ28126.1 ribosome biogenesis GTPase Der [Armatimonadota bacterium]HPO72669.1 ribosome biogenesis GTPase Der [Armatimonadota bacterium]